MYIKTEIIDNVLKIISGDLEERKDNAKNIIKANLPIEDLRQIGGTCGLMSVWVKNNYKRYSNNNYYDFSLGDVSLNVIPLYFGFRVFRVEKDNKINGLELEIHNLELDKFFKENYKINHPTEYKKHKIENLIKFCICSLRLWNTVISDETNIEKNELNKVIRNVSKMTLFEHF